MKKLIHNELHGICGGTGELIDLERLEIECFFIQLDMEMDPMRGTVAI